MPDYFEFKIEGCVVYFTSSCIVEAVHAHAGEDRSRGKAAKIWINEDGSTRVDKRGNLSDKELNAIRKHIKKNIPAITDKWVSHGGKPTFFNNTK